MQLSVTRTWSLEMGCSLEWRKTRSWEKTNGQYCCERIFAAREGKEAVLGLLWCVTEIVLCWAVRDGVQDCSGCSGNAQMFGLTAARSMRMTRQRWEWEPHQQAVFRKGFLELFNVRNPCGNENFGIPESRVPFTFLTAVLCCFRNP